jgi:hypothetical protein
MSNLSSSSADARRNYIPIGCTVCVLLAAVFLRAFQLDNEVIWSDEAFSWRVATRPFSLMVDQVAADVHPLFYFVVLRASIVAFGDSEVALRCVSVAAGIACVVMAHVLCGEAIRFGRRAAPAAEDLPSRGSVGPWLSAAYVAVHPLLIEASRTARMYSLTALLAGLSAWLLLRALMCGTGWRWLLYGLSIGLLLHTHNFGLFTLAAQAAFVAVLGMRGELRGRSIRGAMLAFGVGLVLYAPWLPALIGPSDLRDGTSKTYLIGEKYVVRADNVYDLGNDQSMYSGFDYDTCRWTTPGDAAPRRDGDDTSPKSFGSAHPAGFFIAFADGSVQLINYDVDPEVHRASGNRRDGGL